MSSLDYIPNDYSRGYVASQYNARKGMHVPLAFIDICDGNLYDAILFSQIMYWHEPNKETGKTRLRRQYDGHLWIAKHHGDWYAECRIKATTVRKCLTRLKALKLIVYELHGDRGEKTPFIRMNWETFARVMQAWESDDDRSDTVAQPPVPSARTPDTAGQTPCSRVTAPLSCEVEPNTENTTKTTTNNTTEITTTTPTATPLSSSLSSTSQSGGSLSDSDEQAIAAAILDLFSANRARQLVQEHGYEKIYRACCYVAHANRDKPKDKHLSPRFVFGELNGAGNIPANYQPPVDYSHDGYIDYGYIDAESQVDNDALDPIPELKVVVEAKPRPAPVETPTPKPATQSMSEQSPEASTWRGVVVQVKAQHPSIYESYLQSATLRDVQHNTYVVEVKDALTRDMLQGRYYRLLKALLTGVTGADMAIRFCVAGEGVSIEPPLPDPEPDKPIKVEPVIPAPKPKLKPQLVRAVQVDDKPVTPEQMMAGRRLFNQLAQSHTMGADVSQGKVVVYRPSSSSPKTCQAHRSQQMYNSGVD